MRIDEYIKEEKETLDNFRTWWSIKRRADKESYPSEMDGEGWFEQYLAFLGRDQK